MLAWMSSNGKRMLELLSKALNIDVAYFVRGWLWLFSGYVANAVIKLVLVIVLANLVDRAFYGQYQFVFAVISTMMVFSLPGMDASIAQSVANGHDASLILGTRSKMRWSVLGSLALLGLAAFFKFVRQDPLWLVFVGIAVLFPLYSSFTSVLAYYRGKENFRKATVYNTLISIAGTLPVLAVVFFVKSLVAVVLVGLACIIATYCVLYFKTLREITGKSVDEGVVAYGRDLTFMTALNYVAPYADRFIIAAIAGFEWLAVYSVAMAITLNLSINGQLISILLLPKLSREKPHHEQHIKKLFWWACLAIAIAVAGLILILPWVIVLLFSDKYVESIPYAQIASLYLMFFIPSTILRTFFQARKKTKFLYVYSLGTGVISLVLLGIFVPLLGILGAVISKVVLGFLSFVVLVIYFYTTTKNKSQP